MTIHDLCEQARNTACACGAPPGCPCVCAPREYHPCRFARARASGLITFDDMGYIIRVTRFRNGTAVVIDDEAAAS